MCLESDVYFTVSFVVVYQVYAIAGGIVYRAELKCSPMSMCWVRCGAPQVTEAHSTRRATNAPARYKDARELLELIKFRCCPYRSTRQGLHVGDERWTN